MGAPVGAFGGLVPPLAFAFAGAFAGASCSAALAFAFAACLLAFVPPFTGGAFPLG